MLSKDKHKFKIMKCISDGKYKAIKGVDLLVIHFLVENVYEDYSIIAPLHLSDYSKYFEWLYNEIQKEGYIVLNSMDDLKKSIVIDELDYVASITDNIDDFEYMRDCTEEDMASFTKCFNAFFCVNSY